MLCVPKGNFCQQLNLVFDLKIYFLNLSWLEFEFVFEVSSHAISKQRIRNFPINVAAITNITQDHLDFHKSIKNYKNTKLKLFKSSGVFSLCFKLFLNESIPNDTPSGKNKDITRRLLKNKSPAFSSIIALL